MFASMQVPETKEVMTSPGRDGGDTVADDNTAAATHMLQVEGQETAEPNCASPNKVSNQPFSMPDDSTIGPQTAENPEVGEE